MAITAIQFVCLCTFAESALWNCYLAEKSPVAHPRPVRLQAFIVFKNMRLWTRTSLVFARRDGEPLQPQSLTHEFPRFLAR